MKIWTATVEYKGDLEEVRVFADFHKANDFASGMQTDDWNELCEEVGRRVRSPIAADERATLENYDYLRTRVTIDQHDLSGPELTEIIAQIDINDAWQHCLRQPGAFGVLYDHGDILTIAESTGDESDDSSDSDYFNPSDEQDRAAILAWCEEERNALQHTLSGIVWDNRPTRGAAFAALGKKRRKEPLTAPTIEAWRDTVARGETKLGFSQWIKQESGQ